MLQVQLNSIQETMQLLDLPLEEKPSWGSSSSRGLFLVFEGALAWRAWHDGGLDRSGKSTQSRKLEAYLSKVWPKLTVKALRQTGPVKWMCFPNRKTPIGVAIDMYLRRRDLEKMAGACVTGSLSSQTRRFTGCLACCRLNEGGFQRRLPGQPMGDGKVHRRGWAFRTGSLSCQDLRAGTTIVCDRYAFSGVAYSAAKGCEQCGVMACGGLDFTWCQSPDRGLPCPDGIFFLHIDEKARPEPKAHEVQVGASRSNFGDERYENADMQAERLKVECPRCAGHGACPVQGSTPQGARQLEGCGRRA